MRVPDDDLRSRLEERRSEELQAVAKALADSATPADGDVMRRVRAYDQLLASLPRSRAAQLVPPLLVGVFCFGVAGALSSMRFPSNEVMLSAESTSLSLVPRDTVVLLPNEDASIERIKADQVVEAQIGPLVQTAEDSTGSHQSLTLVSGTMLIDSLAFAAERQQGKRGQPISSLSFEISPDSSLTITMSSGRISMRGLVFGPVNVMKVVGSRPGTPLYRANIQREAAEDFGITSAADGALPAVVRFRPRASIVFRDFPAKNFRFSRAEIRSGGERFGKSSILGGSLLITSINRTVPIAAGDVVEFDRLDGHVLEVAISGRVHLVLQGRAHRIAIGPAGLLRDVTPTYLQFLRESRPLAFFWGAATFLWGAVWSLRRLAFGSRGSGGSG